MKYPSWLPGFLIRLRAFLAGKKTYLVYFTLLIYSVGIKYAWWPNEIEIWGILGSTAAVTIRAALVRILKQFLDDLTAASATPVPTIK